MEVERLSQVRVGFGPVQVESEGKLPLLFSVLVALFGQEA